MLVQSGPQAYTVPDFQGLTIAALAAGEPGDSGLFSFQWPRPVFCTGILIVPRGTSALASPEEEAASLTVEVEDERQRQIITDTRGQNSLRVKPFSMPGLAMSGFGWQTFPLQIAIGEDTTWRIRMRNYAAVAVEVAALMLYFEEPGKR